MSERQWDVDDELWQWGVDDELLYKEKRSFVVTFVLVVYVIAPFLFIFPVWKFSDGKSRLLFFEEIQLRQSRATPVHSSFNVQARQRSVCHAAYQDVVLFLYCAAKFCTCFLCFDILVSINALNVFVIIVCCQNAFHAQILKLTIKKKIWWQCVCVCVCVSIRPLPVFVCGGWSFH